MRPTGMAAASSSERERGSELVPAIGSGEASRCTRGRVARLPPGGESTRPPAQGEPGWDRHDRHDAGDEEEADQDGRRLARRPRLQRLDDEAVAQRPIAELGRDTARQPFGSAAKSWS